MERLEDVAERSQTSFVEKAANFPVWTPRQNIARFLAQAELYREHILPIHGSIIECGVSFGSGLFAWAHLVSIFEHVDHVRRVIGFDSFSGFPGLSPQDEKAESGLAYAGAMAAPVEDELAELAAIHDLNRPLGHIQRIELVEGDACETIPRYVAENPHLIPAALVLDFDVYQPTMVALEAFVPLMPLGGVVVFDEANCRDWPGETTALRESGLLKRGRLRRFPYVSTLSYMVLE